MIAQEEAFARIRLLRSPNIGPVSYRQLLARFGSAEAAIEALPDLAQRGGRAYVAARPEIIAEEISQVRRARAKYLFHDQPGYPRLLAEAAGAPPILTWRGDLSIAERPCVAIVGARNASAAAVKLARDFSAALSAAGFTVVSGLARGIDGAAHWGALPATVGVIASGIDVTYPPEHAELQERVAKEGLLLAEQPPGTEPLARHFPSRNRIIAGLSLGTVVVEAALRSGALISARLAAEAGREVFALPGSLDNPTARGCHRLIREGAALVESPGEVVEALEPVARSLAELLRGRLEATPARPARRSARGQAPTDGDHNRLWSALGHDPTGMDSLVERTGLTVAELSSMLLLMELEGRVVADNGRYARRP